MSDARLSWLARQGYRVWQFTGRYGIQEAVLVVAAFLLYFSIRAAVVSRAGDAINNAYDIIELEQWLGIYWEIEMQSWILDHYAVIRLMNWLYFWGHMPLVILVAIWLYFWHRRVYWLARNSFLASGFLALIVYATYPLAPPRLVPFEGFVDTLALFDPISYSAQETEAFVNPFAAMPSLHFGWSLLIGAAVVRVGWPNPLLVVFGIAWPLTMFFSIVMTGNHFVIDAVGGAIVAIAGFLIALLLERIGPAIVRGLRARIPALDHELGQTDPGRV